MAFFPTYREIVCVVFPPRVKGLMLESWRQSDQKYSQDINTASSFPSVSVDDKKKTGAAMGQLIMMKNVLTFSPRSVGSYRCSDS